jgi:hypothetical protein
VPIARYVVLRYYPPLPSEGRGFEGV